MNIETMGQSCRLFKKLGGRVFDIERPEVECLWSVYVEITPNEKQIKKLDTLGWYYDEETQSFSQYF